MTTEEIDKVLSWTNRFIPPASDQNVIKNQLYSGETVKALTSVQVEVTISGKLNRRVARLELLGIRDAMISEEIITSNPDLLRQGMWGVVELTNLSEGPAVLSFKPMQSTINLSMFKEARFEFSLDEWRRLMLLSMGYAPEAYSTHEQLLLLCRLLPMVQKGMHLMELAPKATGKSYLYENISPRVRLVSGGNITPAVLFVNNATGQWGLLARYGVVVLDEVQTARFEKPDEIVGALKGFLANGKLTRGGLNETSSDCSFVMLANIQLDQWQRPIYGDEFTRELPKFLQETAFLDRIKGLIPGWEIRKLGPDCFANTVGLKADFFGDALFGLRNDIWFDQYVASKVRLQGQRPAKRNVDAVAGMASGLMKILFPHGRITDAELEHFCIAPAVRLRQLIWNQLYRLDAEFQQWDRDLSFRPLTSFKVGMSEVPELG
jgi:ATP-dependent Lon protease